MEGNTLITALTNRSFNSREEIFQELEKSSLLACDTETYSIEDTRLLCISVATSPTTSFGFSPDDEDIERLWNLLSRIPSIWHNVLFDILNLEKQGHSINWVGDTMLLAQSLGLPAALGDLSFEFHFDWKSILSLIETSGRKKILLETVSFREIANICNLHAKGCFILWEKLYEQASKSYQLDIQILPIVLNMMEHGIKLDKQLIEERYNSYSTVVEKMKNYCNIVGFNPASSKSVGIALSERGIITSFTSKGIMKTDKESLLSVMDNEVAILTTAYRDEQKTLSTYLKKFRGLERTYPKYRIVRTGRFAASKPNIQNVPKELRDQYIPDEGEMFWDGDLKQIEPRVIAWLSGDMQMQQDVATGDFYLPFATRYGIDRYTTKQIVLASGYGAGVEKLVEVSHKKGGNISLEDGQSLLESYFTDYHVFASWKRELEHQAVRDGYVTTWLGRKRTLENMLEGEKRGYNPLLKVVNSVVQGTAAEILKLAMLRLASTKIVATIHDELLISTPTSIDLSLLDNLCFIPTAWDVNTGDNWRDLNKTET